MTKSRCFRGIAVWLVLCFSTPVFAGIRLFVTRQPPSPAVLDLIPEIFHPAIVARHHRLPERLESILAGIPTAPVYLEPVLDQSTVWAALTEGTDDYVVVVSHGSIGGDEVLLDDQGFNMGPVLQKFSPHIRGLAVVSCGASDLLAALNRRFNIRNRYPYVDLFASTGLTDGIAAAQQVRDWIESLEALRLTRSRAFVSHEVTHLGPPMQRVHVLREANGHPGPAVRIENYRGVVLGVLPRIAPWERQSITLTLPSSVSATRNPSFRNLDLLISSGFREHAGEESLRLGSFFVTGATGRWESIFPSDGLEDQPFSFSP